MENGEIMLVDGVPKRVETYLDGTLVARPLDALYFDYERQCWIKDGRVAKCAHPSRYPDCYSCNHAGEAVAA